MSFWREDWIQPAWPAPSVVRALSTTRQGGCSDGGFSSMNLGAHVGDRPERVLQNRASLIAATGVSPCWLNQVHGHQVVNAATYPADAPPPDADASFSRALGVGCVVMTADCLPVLFCDEVGSVVAAAHAGWRGLLNGVLEATIHAMNVPAHTLLAWLGPAIGPVAFEVGEEVRAAFIARDPEAAHAFEPKPSGKYLANIYQLARQRLLKQGVEAIFGGEYCTVTDSERFFSYRRDQHTGRMATMIWRTDSVASANNANNGRLG